MTVDLETLFNVASMVVGAVSSLVRSAAATVTASTSANPSSSAAEANTGTDHLTSSADPSFIHNDRTGVSPVHAAPVPSSSESSASSCSTESQSEETKCEDVPLSSPSNIEETNTNNNNTLLESLSKEQLQSSLKDQATSFFQKQDYKKAIELYTQAIEVDPSCEAAAALFSNRSLCHHKLDNFEEALNDGVCATSIRPTWSRGYLRVATAAESLLQNEKAIEAYEKSFELDTTTNDDIKQLYLNLLKKHLENISSKKTQDELKQRGNLYFTNQKFYEALLFYTAAIDLDPSCEDSAAIYSNRSACYFNIDKFHEAHDDGAMATILRPEWPRGWMRRATAAVKIENYEDAHECYEKYFELDPESAKKDEDAGRRRKIVAKLVAQNQAEKVRKEKLVAGLQQKLANLKQIRERREIACQLVRGTRKEDLVISVRTLVECVPELCCSDYKPSFNLFGAAPWMGMPINANSHLLNQLLHVRYDKSEKDAAELKEWDSLIRFVIDVMVEKKYSVPPDALVSACDHAPAFGSFVPPNPDIILALLHTGQMNPNRTDEQGRVPLIMLSSYTCPKNEEPHPSIIASLHALLNWKGIDPDKKCARQQETTALMSASHPEITKLLLRYGASVNCEGFIKRNFVEKLRVNALSTIAIRHSLPQQTEVLRIIIGAGGKLIADGRNGKSSLTMINIFNPYEGSYMSEDAVQMLLQLNKTQGLEMRYRGVGKDRRDMSLLCAAILAHAEPRIVQLLCGMDPSAVNGDSKTLAGNRSMEDGGTDRDRWVTLRPIEAVIYRMWKLDVLYSDLIPLYMQVIEILLDQGADLEAKRDGVPIFLSLTALVKQSGFPLDTFLRAIQKRYGVEYFERFDLEQLRKF